MTYTLKEFFEENSGLVVDYFKNVDKDPKKKEINLWKSFDELKQELVSNNLKTETVHKAIQCLEGHYKSGIRSNNGKWEMAKIITKSKIPSTDARDAAGWFNDIVLQYKQVDPRRHPRRLTSFPTKFLHFIDPDRFPLYDQYAPQCWVYLAGCCGMEVGKIPLKMREPFDAAYIKLLEFYASLFQNTAVKEFCMQTRAQSLQCFSGIESENLAKNYITEISVLDKFCWEIGKRMT